MSDLYDIVYVDDESEFLELFRAQYEDSAIKFRLFNSPFHFIEFLEQGNRAKVLLTDQRMPGMSGSELFAKSRNIDSTMINILTTSFTDLDSIVKIVNDHGLFHYLQKPWNNDELSFTVQKAIKYYDLQQRNQEFTKRLVESHKELEKRMYEVDRDYEILKHENSYLKATVNTDSSSNKIVYRSDLMKAVLDKCRQVATTDATVLITGETGTGKELIAEFIHEQSKRKAKKFLRVNCASFTDDIIESEFFGHEKGAFTGSVGRKYGLFELADKGTIFLDEIGDLSAKAQAAVLRVLQEGEFKRMGGTEVLKTDCRVVAATNKDLTKEIKKGKFRSDLYFRLSIFPIEVAPLRERKSDIRPLIDFFVKRYSRKVEKEIAGVPGHIAKLMEDYNWPGNVRELQNVIERAVIITPNNAQLKIGDWLINNDLLNQPDKRENLRLHDVEKEHLIRVLNQVNWKISGKNSASELLGLHPSTLNSKLAKYGISKDQYM